MQETELNENEAIAMETTFLKRIVLVLLQELGGGVTVPLSGFDYESIDGFEINGKRLNDVLREGLEEVDELQFKLTYKNKGQA